MRYTALGSGLAVGLALLAVSCADIRAPERIEVNVGGGSEHMDSSRVPDPATLEEARSELHRAYRQIQYLERRVAKLEDDKTELKKDRDEYKRKYKRATDD